MIPRRDADGVREIGPISWHVEREDFPGDMSTSTDITIRWARRFSVTLSVNRGWREQLEEHERAMRET